MSHEGQLTLSVLISWLRYVCSIELFHPHLKRGEFLSARPHLWSAGSIALNRLNQTVYRCVIADGKAEFYINL